MWQHEIRHPVKKILYDKDCMIIGMHKIFFVIFIKNIESPEEVVLVFASTTAARLSFYDELI